MDIVDIFFMNMLKDEKPAQSMPEVMLRPAELQTESETIGTCE